MGYYLRLEFEPRLPQAEWHHGEGGWLLEGAERLNSIATSQGLEPVSEFLDENEVPVKWFDIERGMRTFEGVLAVLMKEPRIRRWLDDPRRGHGFLQATDENVPLLTYDDLEALVENLHAARRAGRSLFQLSFYWD